jgi:hypothetical protein
MLLDDAWVEAVRTSFGDPRLKVEHSGIQTMISSAFSNRTCTGLTSPTTARR